MDVMSSSLAPEVHDSVHEDGDVAGLTSPTKAFQECSPPLPHRPRTNQPESLCPGLGWEEGGSWSEVLERMTQM